MPGVGHAWSSAAAPVAAVAAAKVPEGRTARPITELGSETVAHWPSGIGEFDRVLGGGIVPGAAILLSGEPGVGKSTLLLEVASRAARAGTRVLYVSAEESASQVRLRAERTGALADELYLAAETDLATILGHIDAVKPALVIVDSVQTVSSSMSDGAAGQPAQVREVAGTLIRVAKDRNLPMMLVGHVTKDGTIAGPRLLEHIVDVVCSFEGDRQTALRFVRALKNRFGPTDEVGCFEMTGDGIAEVPDPSGLFLSRSAAPVSGTCVTIAMEGRRALPVEVQALIVATQAPQPRRVVNGVDSSRVAMLLAVLERRCQHPPVESGCLRVHRGRHPARQNPAPISRSRSPSRVPCATSRCPRPSRPSARSRSPVRSGRSPAPGSASPRRSGSATRPCSTARSTAGGR